MNSSMPWYPSSDSYTLWPTPSVSSTQTNIFGYPLLTSPPIEPPPNFHPFHTPIPSEPPRLGSPRLFRDFFPAMLPSGPHNINPSPQAQTVQPNNHDFTRAIINTNRAVQDFHAALQPGSSTQSRPPVIDLTQTSPELSFHPQDISQTSLAHGPQLVHPPAHTPLRHRSRPNYYVSSANIPDPPITADQISFMTPLYRRTRLVPRGSGGHWPTRAGTGPHSVEELAVSRQRDNHAAWERTQAAMRRHQQTTENSRTATSVPAEMPSSPLRPLSLQHSVSSSSSVEAVDLTNIEDDSALAATLSQQRQDAVLAQYTQATSSSSQPGRSALTSYKCPICMDNIKDATTTVCGHLFCHSCIMETLKWSEDQRRAEAGTARKIRGVCPVCRKLLDRNDQPGSRRSLVPLELKLMTKKRKRDDKGKQKIQSDNNDDTGIEVLDNEDYDKGKQRKRESTEDALWSAFIDD